jgi:hypothetical protein
MTLGVPVERMPGEEETVVALPGTDKLAEVLRPHYVLQLVQVGLVQCWPINKIETYIDLINSPIDMLRRQLKGQSHNNFCFRFYSLPLSF